MSNPLLRPGSDPLSPAEQEVERALRPQLFEEFAGQPGLVENLQVFIQAARQRGEALDHLLLHGPPGLGKSLTNWASTSALPRVRCWRSPAIWPAC
jgi:Holliday junction DNA helicase RuvB